MKRLTTYFMCLVIIMALMPAYLSQAEEEIPNGFIKAAETAKLILCYREDRAEIGVLNREDGQWWYSRYPDETIYNGVAETVAAKMESLLVFDYVDMGGNSSKVNNLALEETDYTLQVSLIDNGFTYTIVMDKLNITLDIEFTLQNGEMRVQIPDSAFQENLDGLEQSQNAMAEIQSAVASLESIISGIRSGMTPASVGQTEYELFSLMLESCQQEIIKIRDNVKGDGVVTASIANIRSNLDVVFNNLPDPTTFEQEQKEIATCLEDISKQAAVVADSATCLVSSLSLLPYFGSAGIQEDGYAFYPDGSGAIASFTNIVPDYLGYYDAPVYAVQEQDMDTINNDKRMGKENASMPVFGIRSNGSAFVAYIEQGDTDARISYYPCTQISPLNAVYSTFVYRNFYIATTSNAQKLRSLEKERIPGDRQLVYAFLSGDEANYSGMAKAYRQHLVETGDLRKNTSGDQPRMMIDFLMGIRKKGFLFEHFVSMTTFEQAEEVLLELSKRGVTRTDIALLGWNETGVLKCPYSTDPAGKLGGVQGIERLADTAAALGYPLLLHVNPVGAQKGAGGFSTARDVIKQKSSLVVTDSSQTNYWLTPKRALERLLEFLSPNRSWLRKTSGLYIDEIGSLLYTHYDGNSIFTRQNTADMFNDMCEETEEMLGKIMIAGSNVLMASHASVMRDVPTEDTGYFFTSETVPFLQIVYHGYVDYTDRPFNLFANAEKEQLRAIEYGCMPYFKLTYDNPSKLKGTAYTTLFSSQASQWYNEIQAVNKRYQEIFSGIWDCTIESHDKVAEGVYRTLYSDGTAVYVNYNAEPYTYEGASIDPVSYFVSRKG